MTTSQISENDAMRRKTFGGLELSVIDEYDADTQYIYNEVFVSQIYHHPEMRVRDRPTIMDVGANIGIYTIWAQRRYRPAGDLLLRGQPADVRLPGGQRRAPGRPQGHPDLRGQLRHREPQRSEARAAPVHQHIRDQHPARPRRGELDRAGVRRPAAGRSRGHQLDRVGRDEVRTGSRLSTSSRSTSRATSWRC